MNRGSFYLWGTLKDKIYKMYSKNLCNAVSSNSLVEIWYEWIMNIFDDVTGLETVGYLQLNSDESTDTWAAKLPQQCVARWRGLTSFDPGWASAIFQRMDHTHCLRLLGDLWYCMSLVSGNCCVILPRGFRRMFD